MNPIQKKILELKKEKNALILAHFYQPMEVQETADHVCDSFELAKLARAADEQLIILCGVRFMAESAKILNPGKTVCHPVADAGCPMADMVTPEQVAELRARYPDAAVVCYINSSAAVKCVSDICCTSSSAERIVRSLPEKRIIFIPDKNLGAYIASKVPEKEFILHPGFCPTHNAATEAEALAAKQQYPEAVLLAHPECPAEVLKHADFIGSTAQILSEVSGSSRDEFVIATELGVIERIRALNPGKRVHVMNDHFLCPDMKKIALEDVLSCLETGSGVVEMPEEQLSGALRSLERMVEA